MKLGSLILRKEHYVQTHSLFGARELCLKGGMAKSNHYGTPLGPIASSNLLNGQFKSSTLRSELFSRAAG